MDWDPFSRRPRYGRRRPLTPAEQRRRQLEEEAARRAEEEQRRRREAEAGAAPPAGSGPQGGRAAGRSEDAAASPVSQAIIAQFEKELAAARRERDEWEDKYLRTLAETQNMRQRLQRNADERAFQEHRKVLQRFLDVADNLERAIAAVGETEEESPLAEGVRLTYRELQRALADAGVTPLETVGEPFDPNYHEAVATIPTAGASEGTVVEEVQKGYTFQDQLLRPARVIVAR